jgi:hypothetical protein
MVFRNIIHTYIEWNIRIVIELILHFSRDNKITDIFNCEKALFSCQLRPQLKLIKSNICRKVFCRLDMCEPATYIFVKTPHIGIRHFIPSHWAISRPWDWNPGCHDPWIKKNMFIIFEMFINLPREVPLPPDPRAVQASGWRLRRPCFRPGRPGAGPRSGSLRLWSDKVDSLVGWSWPLKRPFQTLHWTAQALSRRSLVSWVLMAFSLCLQGSMLGSLFWAILYNFQR